MPGLCCDVMMGMEAICMHPPPCLGLRLLCSKISLLFYSALLKNFSYYSFHHPYYSPEYFNFRASQFTDKSHNTHYQHTYNTVEHTQGGTLNLSRIEVPELQLSASLLEIESRLVLLVVLDCTDSPSTDMFKVETRGVINLFPYALRLFPHYSGCRVRPIIPKIMPA